MSNLEPRVCRECGHNEGVRENGFCKGWGAFWPCGCRCDFSPVSAPPKATETHEFVPDTTGHYKFACMLNVGEGMDYYTCGQPRDADVHRAVEPPAETDFQSAALGILAAKSEGRDDDLKEFASAIGPEPLLQCAEHGPYVPPTCQFCEYHTTAEETVENYCVDCQAIATPGYCKSNGHTIGTLGHSKGVAESASMRAASNVYDYISRRFLVGAWVLVGAWDRDTMLLELKTIIDSEIERNDSGNEATGGIGRKRRGEL